MNRIVHLRVMSPLLALDATADYVTIPETALIETTDDLTEPGFRQVRFEGEGLLVFSRDIQERTQLVSCRIRSRLLKLEQRILPKHDGFTLEELCRSMWRRDKQQVLEIAKGTSYSFFVRQFEFEDLERGRRTH